MRDIRQQYNLFADTFRQQHIECNQGNRSDMHEMVGTQLDGKMVLDLCCGDGFDANHYKSLGAIVHGLDASEVFINSAKAKYTGIDFTTGLAESMPYQDAQFDCVFSKYAIMTSADMNPIFDEVFRVLKPGGDFIYLVTHPFRQYMERKDLSSNYFEQEEVVSNILDNSIQVIEPTHTMMEYFNSKFFSRFEMIDYREAHDSAAEKVNGGVYPGYFLVWAKKR